MTTTQIQLTDEELTALEELAVKRNVSVADLIREGIDLILFSRQSSRTEDQKKRAIAIAGRFSSNAGDLSTAHNNYLTETFDP